MIKHGRWVGLALVLLALPAAAAAQVTALVGGRVLDGTGGVIENATVVIRDGRFAAVGPADRVAVRPAPPASTSPARR